jgi:hypothetical protein
MFILRGQILEQLLKIGKGLARHEQEIMPDEFFGRVFRAHDDPGFRIHADRDYVALPQGVRRADQNHLLDVFLAKTSTAKPNSPPP